MQSDSDRYIAAVLGPTNTGKTHYAIERMLSYQTGCIGFPLRLLARENYERIAAIKGKHAVALITGEEKIIPLHARFYICTAESMPVMQEFDFVALDEVQLAADPDRGHVFTDRILRMRGQEETLFLGSDTIEPILKSLIPGVEIIRRERLSVLTHTGFKKITRLPKRSAVVAFSAEEVYAVADLIRRQKGGAAVVMGALSPRTRNAQVEMYQSGEVDYLVATDAIGMGLNMDIHHVALASLIKFDGLKLRGLDVPEIAQIAGRAGRYKKDGTFGTTGSCRDLDPEEYEAIQNNDFPALRQIYWRNHDLDFASPKALLKSLERKSDNPVLVRGRVSDDQKTLEALMNNEAVMARCASRDRVYMLWDVCQIPDFRKTLSDKHEELVAQIYTHLCDSGALPEDMVMKALAQLDKPEGEVDTLMARISHIRTWNYITHRKEWHKNPASWAERAQAIEHRLSDALHEALTSRFVDKRASKMVTALSEGSRLLAGIRKDGSVIVEGHKVGTLTGFIFESDEKSKDKDQKAFKAIAKAAHHALKPEIRRRLALMHKFDNNQFTLQEDGQIFWQELKGNPLPGQAVARLKKGQEILKPDVEILENGLLEAAEKDQARGIIQGWVERHIGEKLEGLLALRDENLQGAPRGICWQLYEALGVVPRAQIEDLIAGLDELGRSQLRTKKIRLGPILVFLPLMNKPAPIRLRAMLWALWYGKALPVALPKDGVVSEPVAGKEINQDLYQMTGYPIYGPRAIRIDMLDKVVVDIYDSAKDWTFQAKHSYCEWLGCTIEDLYLILEAMGHSRIEAGNASETEGAEPQQETAEDKKPEEKKTAELLWFKLRRGKMSGEAKKGEGKKAPAKDKKEFKQSEKKPFKKKSKPQKPKDKGPQTHSFEIKGKDHADTDNANPFAVLGQLKK